MTGLSNSEEKLIDCNDVIIMYRFGINLAVISKDCYNVLYLKKALKQLYLNISHVLLLFGLVFCVVSRLKYQGLAFKLKELILLQGKRVSSLPHVKHR